MKMHGCWASGHGPQCSAAKGQLTWVEWVAGRIADRLYGLHDPAERTDERRALLGPAACLARPAPPGAWLPELLMLQLGTRTHH
jgi:hypothetical protein